MEEKFFEIKNFAKDDVFSFNAGICKAGKVIEKIKEVLIGEMASELAGRLNKKMGFCILPRFNIFEEGMECEILKLGAKKWQKGTMRLKITLEFEAESEGFSESLLEKERESVSVLIKNSNNSSG